MATKHGSGLVVIISAVLMTAYFNSAAANSSVDTAEDTAFGDTSKSYIAGLHDGTASLSGMWDQAASGSAATLQTLLGAADTHLAILWEGATVGGRAAILKAIETAHDIGSPVGDVVSAAAEFQADGGLWFGDLLICSALTATSTGSAVNNGVATTDGWVAQQHVTAVSGTATPTITGKLADSADSSSWADVSGGGFTAATAIGSQQISSDTGTLRQYARYAYTISGTNPSLTTYAIVARR